MPRLNIRNKHAIGHLPARIRDWQFTRLGRQRHASARCKSGVATSFERIHRSNLVGMGVLPLQFIEGTSAQTLKLDGSEKFSITGLSDSIKPGQQVTLEIEKNGPSSAKATAGREKRSVPVKLRIDTPIEIDYYRHGGILPFVLRQLLNRES